MKLLEKAAGEIHLKVGTGWFTSEVEAMIAGVSGLSRVHRIPPLQLQGRL